MSVAASQQLVHRLGRMLRDRLRPNRAPVQWGSLRQLSPVSRVFGFDRGLPIDRYYIESFLARHQADIRGDVLEVADATYTYRFGGDRITQSHVLHAESGREGAGIVGDLQTGCGIPGRAFDCIILTQTLPFLFDVRGAVATCHRALRPGGVVLATVPGISQISRFDMDRWGDFWRFTSLSAQRLFETAFPTEAISVDTFGNSLTATALLQGLATDELTRAELDHHDRDYQVLITVRAQCASSPEVGADTESNGLGGVSC